MTLNESHVEDAALSWLAELDYAVGHGPHLAPGEREVEHDSFAELAGWEWLLARGSAKSSDYVAGMQVGERTARRHLNRFLKLGLVTKTGIGPSTEYEVP